MARSTKMGRDTGYCFVLLLIVNRYIPCKVYSFKTVPDTELRATWNLKLREERTSHECNIWINGGSEMLYCGGWGDVCSLRYL